MASGLSISQVLAQLEEKIAHHRERQTFHAQQEEHHREQKALHTAELETCLEGYEAFRSASAAAGELLASDSADAPPAGQEKPADVDPGKKRSLSWLVAQVVEGKTQDETFGAAAVTREIQKRWGPKLGRKVDPRTVAATLRRWAATGRLYLVREGRARNESLFSRGKPPA